MSEGAMAVVPAFHLLAKPTGAIGNLDCAYCFFLSKELLYPGTHFRTTDEVLRAYLQHTLPAHCRTCDVRFACHGECPRNRFLRTPAGEEGLNYLCAGYTLFFHHVDRPMRIMADLLRRQRAPAEIMQ